MLSNHVLRRLVPLALLSSLLVANASAQKLYTWGNSSFGKTTIPVAAQSQVIDAKAGRDFTLALLPDGQVLAWGRNVKGECNVPAAALAGVTTIAAGAEHSLAIKSGGVVAWGSNSFGETTVPANATSGVTAIAAGEAYSLAVKNGGVIGWGNNASGLLNIPADAQTNVTAVAAGGFHCLAVKSGGVIGWGTDVAGSLQIPVAAQSGVTAVSCGYVHSLALKADGTVLAWGWNEQGQTNVPLAARSGVVAISAGSTYSISVKTDGTVVMWGTGGAGSFSVPTGAQPSVGVSTSANHSLALKAKTWATFSETEVFGGEATTGTVHLAFPAGAGGAVVDLVSDSPKAHVPATVSVAEGATEATFPVTTDMVVGSDVTAGVRASHNGSASVAAPVKIKRVDLGFSRGTVVGGSTSKMSATLTISQAPSVNLTVALSSSAPTTLSVPATATFLAGQNTAVVPVTHNLVTAAAGETVTLTAFRGAAPVAMQSIVVQPFRATVALTSPSIVSGESTFAGIYLNAAPRASVLVSILGSTPGVSTPSSITVNAGSLTNFFQISTAPAATTFNYPVTVSISGNIFSSNLKVESAPSVKSITLGNTIMGNTKVVGTVTLTRAAGVGGTILSLSAMGGLSVPTTVTVPAGFTTATFDVTASDVPVAGTGQVTAASAVNQVVKNLTMKPITPSTFSLSTGTVPSGGTFTGTVTLAAVVNVDTQVQLTASNLAVSVPATVTILAGSNSANFSGQASSVATIKQARITATKNGKSLKAVIVVSP